MAPWGQAQRWPYLMFLVLACVPLIKPYLGMLFPAYLAGLFQQPMSSRQRWRSISLLAVCCLPFAAFVGYSVIAAEQSGTISALTWFTTDNPIEIREATGVADSKTAADWLRQSAETVRFHLVYHTVTAPLPWLSWCGLPDWSWPARLLMFFVVGGLMFVGAWQSWRQRDVVSLSYTAAMWLFFVVFACDSARFFTVLTPMCALLFCRGVVRSFNRTPQARAFFEFNRRAHTDARACGVRLNEWLPVALLASALLATGLWVRQRAGHAHDPNPFYDDLYAALEAVRENPAITELRVPYQMREIASLETGKRIQVSDGGSSGVARLTFRPREELLQKRYARHLSRDEGSESSSGSGFRRIWSSPTQQVHIELADEEQL